MIDIESITFSNFLSYGDYQTTIPISKLGPCLITGANGAGKSTVYNVILWVLFQRTMHAVRPGDRIVNQMTGKNCYGRIDLKNGDSIVRTRKMVGHNELLVKSSGETILETLSTTPNQQLAINKRYDLDWYAFCNSSFFTQKHRGWLEMPDGQRKKELERALRVDRLSMYAIVGKEKNDQTILEQSAIKNRYQSLQDQIATHQEHLISTQTAETNFETDRTRRYKEAVEQARAYKQRYEAITIPDLDDLRNKWAAIDEAKKGLQALETKARSHAVDADVASRRVVDANKNIAKWHSKGGALCPDCMQTVPHEHVGGQIKPFEEARDDALAKASTAKAAADKLTANLERVREAIKQSQPTMTLGEAREISKNYDALLAGAQKWALSAQSIKQEVSPYIGIADKLRARIVELTAERDAMKSQTDEADILVRHYSYIYRAYNDRRKIKSASMAEHTPRLNTYWAYWLDKFKLPAKMSITDSLTIDSDVDYDFMSGGEQTRAGAAFMLARFELHEFLHGRQCNVIVLDEIDSKMDSVGVECLTDIVINDLAKRVDAILVISHRDSMRHAFSNQILVEKHHGLSVIGEMR